MKLAAQTQNRRGFSLVELLMAIAILSMIAAMAMFAMSGIFQDGKRTVVRHNAKSFAQMVAAAKAAGFTFTTNTKEGMLAELVRGVNGAGPYRDSTFRLNVQPADHAALLRLCSVDAMGFIRVDA